MRFCADEAADAGAKLTRADQLGLGAEVAADLRAGARSVVKKYLEAEEGARAVFAAAKITRRDAETVAPGATKAERASGFESESSFPRGALADVFAEMDALREEFEALERPEMAAWGMESEEGEGEESEEEGERTEEENGTEAENGTETENDGGGERRRVGADDPTAPAPQEPREAEEVEEAEEAEEVENTTEFAEEVHPEAHHPEAHAVSRRPKQIRDPRTLRTPTIPRTSTTPTRSKGPRSRTTPKRRGRRRTTRRSTRTTTRTMVTTTWTIGSPKTATTTRRARRRRPRRTTTGRTRGRT